MSADTVAGLVAWGATRLAVAGVDSPRHDAEELVAHVLGTTRGRLAGRSDPLPDDQAAAVRALVERRATRVPLQHLTGVAGFRHLELAVGPGVFVPRPETELLAGAAIDELRRLRHAGVAEPLAVDLCTGSGAVAAALASEVDGSQVVAIEISPAAHAYAERNARGLAVDVRLGDMADSAHDLDGRVHVVTANPPYIPIELFEQVAVEAREFDPPEALWSGADGLAAMRVVARVAARLLVPGGLVLCEHADSQHTAATAVFATAGDWRDVADHDDLAGRPRYVSARRVGVPAASAGTIAP